MLKNNKLLKEFGNFVNRGSAIDMAVGIIVGSVMTGLVKARAEVCPDLTFSKQ